MGRPEPAVTYHGREEPVVEGIELAVNTPGVTQVRDRQGEVGSAHCTCYISGYAWGETAGITYPPDDQFAKDGVTNADKVTLGGSGIEVINSLGSIRPLAGADC